MAKTHMKAADGNWKFKRQRDGDKHIRNCSDQHKTTEIDGHRLRNVHHILCVHACSDATFPHDANPERIQFIHECLAITEWDINGKGNNIALPKKWSYVLDRNGDTGWGNLPCHQVDHDIYLKEVESYVRDKIWNKLRKSKKRKSCEDVNPEAIAYMFDRGSRHWRSFLVTRGAEHGGTKRCLDYCLGGSHDPELEAGWYVPFSMAHPSASIRRRAKPKLNRYRKLLREGLLDMIT